MAAAPELVAELRADPQAIGYAGKQVTEVERLLNIKRGTASYVEAAQLSEIIRVADFTGLTADQRAALAFYAGSAGRVHVTDVRALYATGHPVRARLNKLLGGASRAQELEIAAGFRDVLDAMVELGWADESGNLTNG